MPNAATLSSEYVPTRHRPFAVTLTIVCIPLGGSLAGFIGGQILPRFGWHVLFVVCGLLPLVLAAVPAQGAARVAAVPGPPQGALAGTRRASAPPRSRRRRTMPSFVDASEKRRSRAHRWVTCSRPNYLRDTLTLFGSFFFCLLTVYMGTNWVPSMLVGSGFDVGTASYGLTAFNVGGVIGAILGAIDHHAARLADLDAHDGGGRGGRRRRADA